MAAKGFLGGPLRSRGPPKDHLAAKGCPGFVVEFNTYNITLMSPMSLITLMKGGPRVFLAMGIRWLYRCCALSNLL